MGPGDVKPQYQPMTLSDLARQLTSVDVEKWRWKLVWEFLEEYRWEGADSQDDCSGRSLQSLVMNDGMSCWPRWRSTLARSLIWLRRPGWSRGC
jgi:hypothetical protein